MVRPYEFGVDNSVANVVTTFILGAGFWIAAFFIGHTCNVFSLTPRFPFQRPKPTGFPPQTNDSLYSKFERVTSSYVFAFGIFGLSFLFQGIVRESFPSDVNPETGYLVLTRLARFFLYIGCSSIVLAAGNPNIVGELPNQKFLTIATRVIAALYDVLAIVLVIMTPAENFEWVGGIVFALAFLPAFVTAVVSLRAHLEEDAHLDEDDRWGAKTTGRLCLAAANLFTMLFVIIFIIAFNPSCAKFEPQPTCDCVFDVDYGPTVFFNICMTLNLIVYALGLLRVGTPTTPAYTPAIDIGTSNPNVSFDDNNKKPEEKPEEPPVSTPKPTVRENPAEKNQEKKETEDNESKGKGQKNETKRKGSETKRKGSEKKKEPNEVSNPAFDSSGSSTGLTEDSVLKKMYDLFTKSDSGEIDDADAGLTPEEFKATVTVAKLQEILAPIGGLDLSRVDPSLTQAKGIHIPISLVFETLDTDNNHRVTATEFVKLLRKHAAKVYTVNVRDSILKKLYDLFSKADSGRLDVADAGLTQYELMATVTMEELEEILKPIGGLDLTRVDPDFKGDVDMSAVFKALDKNNNDRITATEFIKLLREKKTIIGDLK